MSTTTLRADDIVQVEARLAFVVARVKNTTKVKVRFAHGAKESREIRGSDITGHWRKMR